jgi:hypothetical protein
MSIHVNRRININNYNNSHAIKSNVLYQYDLLLKQLL